MYNNVLAYEHVDFDTAFGIDVTFRVNAPHSLRGEKSSYLISYVMSPKLRLETLDHKNGVKGLCP